MRLQDIMPVRTDEAAVDARIGRIGKLLAACDRAQRLIDALRAKLRLEPSGPLTGESTQGEEPAIRDEEPERMVELELGRPYRSLEEFEDHNPGST